MEISKIIKRKILNKKYKNELVNSFKIKNNYHHNLRFRHSLNYFLLFYIENELNDKENIEKLFTSDENSNITFVYYDIHKKLFNNLKTNILPVLQKLSSLEEIHLSKNLKSNYESKENLEFYKIIEEAYTQYIGLMDDKNYKNEILNTACSREFCLVLMDISTIFSNLFEQKYRYIVLNKLLKNKNLFIDGLLETINIFHNNLHNSKRYLNNLTIEEYYSVNIENANIIYDTLTQIYAKEEFNKGYKYLFDDKLFFKERNYNFFSIINEDIKDIEEICLPLKNLLNNIKNISGFTKFNNFILPEKLFILKYKNEEKNILCGIENKEIYIINYDFDISSEHKLQIQNSISEIKNILADIINLEKKESNIYICDNDFIFYTVDNYHINQYLDISLIISNNFNIKEPIDIISFIYN